MAEGVLVVEEVRIVQDYFPQMSAGLSEDRADVCGESFAL